MPLALPIDPLKSEFIAQLRQHHLVVEAQTGSGKSTRLPLWAAQSGARVLVVEPRRIACTALADFVGQGRDDVGYVIRFDSSVDDRTQIAFVTPGIALRWLSEDGLASFGTIIIDEFHERRWDTDLLLALLKQAKRHRLVLTSATIDGERLANYLGGMRLQAEGRVFPVAIEYHASDSQQLPSDRELIPRLKSVVLAQLPLIDGDLLLFLPGRKEIAQAQAALSAALPDFLVLPLHANVDKALQRQALTPSTGQRRIVLATNVAETSLTIPGITLVIDSGLERRTSQRNGRTVLSLTRISKASAAQRAGRAGRTAAGRCIRLWGQHAPLESLTPPELQREELVEPMLAAACAGADLAALPWLDPLPAKSLQLAQQRLQAMAAIDAAGKVTEHGKRLFPLPIDTQFAHLISAMPSNDLTEAMVDLAAALSIGGRLWQLPQAEAALQALTQWQPLPCDGTTLVKIVREQPPLELNVDPALRQEARQLAEQIRAALELPQLTAASYLDRPRWLKAMLAVMPDLAFVRRAKRREALGNGLVELQPSRDTRFSDDDEAALVLDQFALPGRGVRQTISLATCMLPVSLKSLCEAGLGDEQLAENGADEQGQRLHQRYYAGRVIGSEWRLPEGSLGFELMVQQILTDQRLSPAGSTLIADAHAWALYLSLQQAGLNDQPDLGLAPISGDPIEPQLWLTQRLAELGVESADDLALIEPSDLRFAGIPDWQRAEFDQRYPQTLALPELQLQVEYSPKGKQILLHYLDGRRKDAPKRWELPAWSGWRIRYRKASKVVDVR
ncbi:helicase-related protein [Ferrimonas senticii]|uniref:helicase-related protein n=1 Tax=Ferrimonas senticii TaxID=394566 RepID=UPI00042357A3|nr:helicase-related protein [Ferrimonas senticii]